MAGHPLLNLARTKSKPLVGDGGAAWVPGEKPYHSYSQYSVLEKELAKQMRVILC